MGLWLPPLLAAEVHFADQLEARRMAELIRRERISVLVAVPRVLQLLRTHLLAASTTSAAQLEATKAHPKLSKWWRFRRVHSLLGWKFWAVISGGAALPTELESSGTASAFAVIQGYGMTETTALITSITPSRSPRAPSAKPSPAAKSASATKAKSSSAATCSPPPPGSGQNGPREGEWLSTGDLGERNEQANSASSAAKTTSSSPAAA
jgi:long-chain acyl-CoA synthetase